MAIQPINPADYEHMIFIGIKKINRDSEGDPDTIGGRIAVKTSNKKEFMICAAQMVEEDPTNGAAEIIQGIDAFIGF